MRWLRFPRGFGIAVCLYFVGLAVFFGIQTSQRFVFLDNARSVPGTVVALEPRTVGTAARARSGPGIATAPRVRYEVGGTAYEITSERARINQRLRPGDQVSVLYDPDEPGRAQLQGEGRLALPLITAGFAACALGVAAVLVLTRRLGRSRAPVERRAAAVTR